MTTALNGRVALVTGAAGGFGSRFTPALLRAGAAVMATDVDEDGLERLGTAMRGEGLASGLDLRPLDISAPEACAAAVEAAGRRFGSLDILINNGALGMPAIREDSLTNPITIEELTPAWWDRMVAVNLSGAWYMTRAAVPGMKRRRWGRIITVTTSFFSMLRGRFHPYGPAKAGLEAMAAGHAKEFAPDGITVNVVIPGGLADTPMVPESSGYRREDMVPAVKMVPPVLWLCSAAADDVTGQRYVAAHWDESAPVAAARAASEAPIAWPDLAQSPVWPGGTPDE